MNAHELFTKDGKPTGWYLCFSCGKPHQGQPEAANCCLFNEIEWRPFTAEEIHVPSKIRSKKTGRSKSIIGVTKNGVQIWWNDKATFKELLAFYAFHDGKPCGVKLTPAV